MLRREVPPGLPFLQRTLVEHARPSLRTSERLPRLGRSGRRRHWGIRPLNIIEVTNLTKKFGEITAVDDISFSVAEGEIFAFLGPSGAGKSTTIKMLTTLLHATSGKIVVNGHDPTKAPDEVRKSF